MKAPILSTCVLLAAIHAGGWLSAPGGPPVHVQAVDPALGATNSGTISLPGQQDRFVFTGTAGQRLYYDTLDLDSEALRVRLEAPSGVTVWGSHNHSSEPVPIYLADAGTYTLVVDGQGDAVGDYRFRLLDVATQPALAAGVTRSGQLNPGTQTHVYRLPATNGQTIHLERVSASSADANWRLVDPANNVVASASIGDHLGNVFLRLSGTYLLVIEGTGSESGTLNYEIRVTDVSDTPVAASGFDTVRSGTVGWGETNRFTFTASAGTVAYYDSLQGYNGVTVQWLDPDGNLLHQGDAGYNGGPLVLPRSGTYRLDIIGTAAGDYRFRMLNGSAAPVLTLGAISNGVFSLPYSAAIWRFSGQVGQRLLYDAAEPDNESVQLTVLTPALAQQFWQNAEDDSARQTLAVPGTYYVLVESQTGDPADYAFRLLDLAQPPSVALAFNTAVTNTLGSNLVQLYRFNAVVGQRLFFDALGADASGTWALYDPVSTYPIQASMANDFVYTAIWSGQHIVVVSASSKPLDYAFRVLTPASTNVPLTLGASVSGTITATGEEHCYTFTGTVGQRLYYDALQNDWQNINARLLSPSGQTLWSMNSDGETRPLTLSEAGSYTLVLGGFSDALGSYCFRLIDVDRSPAAALALNTLVSGTNNPGLQAAVFRIPLTANHRLFYDSQWAGTGDWVPYGPDNGGLGGYSLNNDFEALPTLSGTGLLILSGSTLSPCVYGIRVVDPVHATNALPLGTVVSNWLAGAGSEHWLTFNATPGQRLFYDALDQDWDVVSVYLITPDGATAWGYNADNDYGPFTVTQPGTHILLLHNSTDAAADYRFRLLDLAAQPALTTGVAQNGQLAPKTQAHLYRLPATNGQRLNLQSTAASSSEANWRLIDPLNRTLVSANITADLGTMLLPIPGTYVVAVEGTGPDSGTLNYGILPSDTTESPVAASGFGSFVGNLAAGETNLVHFNATAGTPIYVDSLINNGSARLYLVDTNGTLVFEADGSTGVPDPGFFILPTSGTYTLEVVGTAGGDYAFRIWNLSTEALPLTPATVVPGVLTNGFQVNIYRLDGTNGQRLFYDALEGPTSGDYGTVYSALVAPNFEALFGSVTWWWSQNARADAGPVTLSSSGPHYLVLMSGSDRTDHYTFRLLDLFQPPARTISVGATFGTGLLPVPASSLVATGSYVAANLRSVDEPDWRVTQTIAGTRMDAQINFSNSSWGALASVGLTPGPNGSDADWDNFSVQWDGYITVTNAGTRLYLFSDNSSRLWVDLNSNSVFEASELLDNHWGSGAVGLSPASPALPPGMYAFRLQYEEDFAPNQMVLLWDNGFNLAPYEAAIFRFTSPPARFFFDSLQPSSVAWSYYPPASDNARNWTYGLTDFEAASQQPGTNLLILRNDTASGQPCAFRVLSPAAATNALTFGTTCSGSLAAGEEHWFTFAGTAGQRIYYDALDPQGGNVWVALVAPSGSRFIGEHRFELDQGPVKLTETGTYRLWIHNYADATTPYAFRVLDVKAQPIISLDATHSGSVALGTTAKLFRFDSLAGLSLFFDDLGSGPSTGGGWYLWDVVGQQIRGHLIGWDFDAPNPALTGEYLLVFNSQDTNAYNYSFRIVPGNHAPDVHLRRQPERE